ncbi:MAG: hypothetical protein AAB539_00025 [Patescibacteria group bacterium]
MIGDAETRVCQNCKNTFRIEPEDFSFYARLKVPPPTWCPECRMVRRMVFRNERVLYRRHVVGHDEPALALFPESSGFKVYYQKDWQSADFDAGDLGKEYDFSRPLFEQIKRLMHEVPWQHSYNRNAVQSEYCSNALDLKGCYLMFNSGMSENCAYGTDVLYGADALDLLDASRAERSYELVHSERCSGCLFGADLRECTDVYFSFDMTNCHDCIGCVGLRNKQYCIFNAQYTKEDYLKEKGIMNLGSHRMRMELLEKAENLRMRRPVKFMHGFSNVNATGDYLQHCKNARQSFMSRGLEDCAYCQKVIFGTAMFGGSDRDSYDLTIAAGERGYENCIGGGYQVLFSWLSILHSDIVYSMNCMNCTHLFACIGLRNKQYCILNKQYTKEEYEALVPRIIAQMNEMPYVDAQGRTYRYGEFFPPELSPFAYNDTIAQEFFPLSKKEAQERGYRWRDPEEKNYTITRRADDLPDHIKDVDDAVLNDIIGCAHDGKCQEQCTTAFRIIPQEFRFYKKMNVPLPRLCPNCRHFQRIKQRNPLKLWHRTCMCAGTEDAGGLYKNAGTHFHGASPCPNEFETSFPPPLPASEGRGSPDRKEIVYCGECYQQEVS